MSGLNQSSTDNRMWPVTDETRRPTLGPRSIENGWTIP